MSKRSSIAIMAFHYMLKVLRKKGVSKKLLWVIAIVIIISFGIFGTANYYNGKSNPTSAGKIFGQNVPFDKFQESLLHVRNQAILRLGDNFNRVAQFLDMETEAWDRLILLYEAKKRRIRILDAEVVDTIEDFDFFKNQGKFDPSVYKRMVRYIFRCEPRQFEEGIRESLIFSKLFEQETGKITVSGEEALQKYREKNEKIQVSYVFFPFDDFKKDINLTPVEAEEFFNRHKDEFRLPPAINIQYLDLSQSTKASQADKAAEDASTAEPAKNIIETFKENRNLEELAKKFNLELKETGFFSMENSDLKTPLPFEILQAAFSLKVGETSEPIETSQGYFLIKVKEKRDSYVPTLKEAAQQVTEVLANQKAKELARAKAEESLKEIKARLEGAPSKAFTDIVQELSLKTTQTAPFIRGEYLPGIGLSKEFQDTAFSLTEKDKVSRAVEIPKGYCIIHYDNLTPIDQEKFTKEKEEFMKTLLLDKKNDHFNNFIQRLRTKADLRDYIARLKNSQNASY